VSRWQLHVLLDDRGLAGIPRSPGVYAFYVAGALAYIGSTANLRERIASHGIRYSYPDSIQTPWGSEPSYVPVGVKFKTSKRRGDWASDEIRLVSRLRPPGNKRFFQ
jgi:hypothetical protein